MLENVDERQMPDYTLSLPGTSGSGELKTYFKKSDLQIMKSYYGWFCKKEWENA